MDLSTQKRLGPVSLALCKNPDCRAKMEQVHCIRLQSTPTRSVISKLLIIIDFQQSRAIMLFQKRQNLCWRGSKQRELLWHVWHWPWFLVLNTIYLFCDWSCSTSMKLAWESELEWSNKFLGGIINHFTYGFHRKYLVSKQISIKRAFSALTIADRDYYSYYDNGENLA